MISGFRCDDSSCGAMFRVSPAFPSVSDRMEDMGLLEMLLAQHWTCPVCGGSRLVPTTKQEGRRLYELTVKQLWNAVNGRGLPDQVVSESLINVLFTQDKVKSIKMGPVPSGAIVIEEIGFECGSVLHFGVSGGQAAVYKVTKEKESADADQAV